MVSVKGINDYLNNLPGKIKKAPLDEKIAYFSVIGGILMIIIWLLIKIVF